MVDRIRYQHVAHELVWIDHLLEGFAPVAMGIRSLHSSVPVPPVTRLPAPRQPKRSIDRRETGAPNPTEDPRCTIFQP